MMLQLSPPIKIDGHVVIEILFRVSFKHPST
jgi:hypothetical protein